MSDHHTLVETERVIQSRAASAQLDFESAHAVASICRAANAVRTHVTTEVFRPAGISWTGFEVMWVVWVWDGLETRHAAEAAAISKATLTGVVKTLVAKGWMTKRSGMGDRRLVELQLTAAGRELMEDLYPKFNAIEAAVINDMSLRQKHEMTDTLRSIVTNLKDSATAADRALGCPR